MSAVIETPKIQGLGDDALLVTFADAISWDIGVRVRRVAKLVCDMQLEAVTDVVPAYTTLAVYFDRSRGSFAAIATLVADVVAAVIDEKGGHVEQDSVLVEIPVRYDGPDLAEVAARTGLTVEEVVARHSSRTYRAYMSGFVPGFAYLGDLDESLVLARRTVPRVRVSAGSVAIAGRQTAVYPLETPGGWHLIGTTPVTMFDATRDPPALVRAGDTVRFVDVDR